MYVEKCCEIGEHLSMLLTNPTYCGKLHNNSQYKEAYMAIPREDEMRKCTKCGIVKPMSDYLPYRIKSNGRKSWYMSSSSNP